MKNATEATKRQPCHNCAGTDYCLIYPDGGCNCYRAENPDKKDKSGALYRYCPPSSGPRRREESQNVVDGSPELATPDQLDRFYRELQLQLTLNPKHKEGLRTRGLSDKAIQAYGLRSTPARGTLNTVADHLFRLFSAFYQNVPGAYLRENGKPALAIPAGTAIFGTNLEGRMTQVQFRLDRASAGDSRYRLFSSKSEKDGRPGPSPKVEPYLVQPVTVKPQKSVLRICEGYFKAAVAAERTGITAIAATSVGSLSSLKVYAGLKNLKPGQVLLPLDQTAFWKPAVTRQVRSVLADYRKWSKELGFSVMVETWGAAIPIQERPDGIDDALAAGLEVVEISLDECERLLPLDGESQATKDQPKEKGIKVVLTGLSGRKAEQITTAICNANEPLKIFVDRSTGMISDLRGKEVLHCKSVETLAHICERRLGLAFYGINKDGQEYPMDPPEKPLKRILGMPAEDTGLPQITEFIDAPVLAPDKSLVINEGLHPSGYYLRGGLTLQELPSEPSLDLVAECREKLALLWSDFPFEENTDRQAYWSYILTPFIAGLAPRPWPMWHFSAPMQGSGKGMLASLPALIAQGEAPGVLSLDTSRGGDAEIRKVLTSLMDSNPGRWQIFDNVRGYLASGALEAFLTSTHWKDRVLGTGRMGFWPIKIALAITGNNLTLSPDLERRQILVRVAPNTDKPWLRKDFRFPNLSEHVQAKRLDILWQILVLVQHWRALGFPLGKRSLGSFEGWAAAIGGLLDAIGVGSEFLTASRSPTVDDPWVTFAQAWFSSHVARSKQATSELVRFTEKAGIPLSADSPASSLGKKMRRQTGKVFRVFRSERDESGLLVKLEFEPYGNNTLWNLTEITLQSPKPPNSLQNMNLDAIEPPKQPPKESSEPPKSSTNGRAANDSGWLKGVEV